MSKITVKELEAPTGFDLKIAAGETLDLKSQGSIIMPAGHILQTVQTESTTQVTVNSSSWADINLSASITPISTSSKILVHIDNSIYQTAGNHITVTVFRGSVASGTNLGTSSWGFGSLYDSNNSSMCNLSYTHLDSPNTTSAITYNCAARAQNGTAYVMMNTNKGNITLMEVAG